MRIKFYLFKVRQLPAGQLVDHNVTNAVIEVLNTKTYSHTSLGRHLVFWVFGHGCMGQVQTLVWVQDGAGGSDRSCSILSAVRRFMEL